MAEIFSVAAQVLKAWGADVVPLPTSTKEESDWLATLSGCRLLVEEKMKFEATKVKQARSTALGAGKVHGTSVALTHNNRISGIVRKAASQLSSSGAAVPHDLKVLWFTGMDADGEARHFQLMSTLYGSTRVFELGHQGMRPCYFFRNGDFFRYKEQLDGAVVSYRYGNEVTVKLCLNPYSPNWKALRDSPFALNFKTGLIDPVAEEASGMAYIVDADIPRDDERAVLHYLEAKYRLKQAQNMDMSMHSAAVAVTK